MKSNITEGVFYGQICGFIVAFVSGVTCTVTCVWNQWSKTSSSESASVLGAIWGFNGIWIQCVQHSTGQFQCNNYNTAVINLPAYMNAIRAFMCIAIIFSVVGCFMCLIGMQCSRLLETMPNAKRLVMQIAGGLFIGAGALTTASLSWYTAMIIQDFFSYTNYDNMMRYTLGATMYVGIFSAILSFSAGVIFLCLPGPKEEQEKKFNFEYNRSTARSTYKRPIRYNESQRSLSRYDEMQYV
ncbi:claudin-19-like [Styela clava]|uniref:claudin-19-like n=1 Tax=Styela clava TaxID=7725 RepID=UPI001939A6B4|nr:claudin-19-like [Styela clava]